MQVAAIGKTLGKIFPLTSEKQFDESFFIKRPELENPTFSSTKQLQSQLVVIECKNKQRTTLRGQIEFLPETNQLLFLGSPWFGAIEQVIENNLTLHDFAYHDPMIDLLHVLKTQEITTEDLKHLLKTINQQKETLKKDKAELERLSMVASANENGIVFTDEAGKIFWCNEGMQHITGRSKEEIIGKTPVELLRGPLTDKEVIKKMVDDFSNHRSFQNELIHYRKDGSWYWGKTKGQAIKNKDGKVNYFAIIEDISIQKASEEQLRILSSIAAENTHGVVIANEEGQVEWINKSFETITGYSLDEMKGKKPGHILQGPETNPETIIYIRKQIEKGEPFVCEILNYHKNGNTYWLRLQGQALKDERGKVVKYFAIEEDITKEKESQQKLKEFDQRINLAMQMIGDNVWEHDFITEQTSFSQQEFKLLGFTTDEFNNNVDLWYNCIHKDDREKVRKNDLDYRSGLIDHHSLEYRMIHKEGSVRWVLDRGVVLAKTTSGKPLKIIGTHTDITEQKETEQKLESTASRLTSLISNLNAAVLLENENRTVALLNQRFCEFFNIPVSPAQLIGTDYSQSAEETKHLFINPDEFVSRINQLLKDKQLITGDKLELTDGRVLERDFIPIWNEGQYQGHLWVYAEITEKMNADKKLEAQRLFYEEILDNIPADIAVFDKDHRYLYVNPKAIADRNVRKWVVGKTDTEYLSYRNKPMYLLESRNKVFNNVLTIKQLQSWEEELKQPDGSSRYVLRNMYPVLNELQEVVQVIGYGIDITERKLFEEALRKNEEKYRGIIANMNLGLIEIDINKNISFANQSLMNMVGSTAEKIIGSRISDYLPVDQIDYVNQKTEERKKGISEAFELPIQIDDKKRWWLVSSAPKFNDRGEFIGSIVICLDINEQKELEKELIMARERAEQLAQTKETFLANMSHEIRTPMNAIIGMGNQLAKTSLNQQQQFYLGTINTAAENLLIIINDILDLSKIDAGKLAMENIGFDPKLVVGRAMQVMMHRAEEKGIILTNTFCDAMLSPVLIGDPYRLNQVLLNLLSNAIKFTEKGSVDVSCKIIDETEAQQTVQVSVIDTGIGMDESFIKNLFQKFKQEDESVTRKFGGTGLGMSICKELVELMGGNIEVKSVKGKGTAVMFTITFKKGTAADLPVKETEIFNTNILAGKKILVTDDNEMNRLVASTILKNYGAEIEEAQNGKDAIEKLDKQKFDIILMDVQMPVMDGVEATKEIRKSVHKNIPIIALTAFAIKGDDKKFINAGMNDYLSKPFEENQLLNVISRWVGKKYSLTEKEEGVVSKNTLYNLSKLQSIAKGNQAFIDKMTNLFIEQGPASVKEMKAAFALNDFSKVGAIAHRMKPSIDNMGIVSLKEVIRSVEKNAADQLTAAEIKDVINNIEDVINKVVVDLKSKMA